MQPALQRRMTLPPSLLSFFIVAFVLNVLGVCCAKYADHVLHLPWPYRTVGMDDSPCTDLMFAIPIFRHVHTPDFFSPGLEVPFMYPAALAPVFGALLSFRNPVAAMETAIAVIVLTAASLFGWRLRRTGLGLAQSIAIPALAVCASFPVWFETKQGNTEIFVWALLALSIWCFVRNRMHTAAVLIGAAIAMKMFPFMYLGLFLARKRYLPILTSLVSAAAVTLLSLLYIGPTLGVAWHGIAQNLDHYQRTVPLVIRREIGFDHSLFAATELLADAGLHRHLFNENFSTLLHWYLPLIAVAGCLLYFLRIRFLPFTNQVVCLTICSIFFPPVSYDYTLLHLYTAWALLVFVAAKRWDFSAPGLRIVFGCLAVATSVCSEFIRHGRGFGGQIKALALLVALGFCLRYPFPHEAFDGDRSSTSEAIA